MYQTRLEKIKEQLKTSRNASAVTLLIAAVFFTIFVSGNEINTGDVIIYVVNGALAVYSVLLFVKYCRLLKMLELADEGRVCEVRLCCPKVRPVAFSGFRATRKRYSRNRRVIGIALTDEKKGKYYYFFGETLELTPLQRRSLVEKFSGDLSVQCYDGTRMIKSIENDPYFFSSFS